MHVVTIRSTSDKNPIVLRHLQILGAASQWSYRSLSTHDIIAFDILVVMLAHLIDERLVQSHHDNPVEIVDPFDFVRFRNKSTQISIGLYIVVFLLVICRYSLYHLDSSSQSFILTI